MTPVKPLLVQASVLYTFAPMQQQEQLRAVLHQIVPDPSLHARWLNSLSMMENTGARKIARYEDPLHTSIIVLKHAAEEARHAYYLKKQIEKIGENICPDYSFPYLIAPLQSFHYLHQLDTTACRYLKDEMLLTGRQMKHGAYLLVTYAIEVRADMLYGVYQEVLTEHGSRVNVKSIIAEEEGHLMEMKKMLVDFHPDWQSHTQTMLALENALFEAWLSAVASNVPAMA
jgi:hypothetical protein